MRRRESRLEKKPTCGGKKGEERVYTLQIKKRVMKPELRDNKHSVSTHRGPEPPHVVLFSDHIPKVLLVPATPWVWPGTCVVSQKSAEVPGLHRACSGRSGSPWTELDHESKKNVFFYYAHICRIVDYYTTQVIIICMYICMYIYLCIITLKICFVIIKFNSVLK